MSSYSTTRVGDGKGEAFLYKPYTISFHVTHPNDIGQASQRELYKQISTTKMTNLPVFTGLYTGFMAGLALIYIIYSTTSIKWCELRIKIFKNDHFT